MGLDQHTRIITLGCDILIERAENDLPDICYLAYSWVMLWEEVIMLRPFSAVAAVCAVHTVRRHSRECQDLAAREYLIRVERRLIAMVLEDWPPTLH